jgi:hypothetical protein
VTAADVLDRARNLGVELRPEGQLLRYRGRRDALAELLPNLAALKPQIMEELRKHGTLLEAHAILCAQRLLRDCKFPPEAAPCSFHCGHPSEGCKRCGAPLFEHYPKPT